MIFIVVEIMEIFVCECVGNLNCVVWFEIIENYRIVVLDCCNRFIVFFCDYRWNYEFIIDFVCI